MLNKSHIEDLIYLRLTEGQTHKTLADLSAEKVDLPVLQLVLSTMFSASCVDQTAYRFLGEGAIDCSGTGGSGIANYNTSTSVAFVLAAGGAKVVKFGNRAASGSVGSSDFLESIGIICPSRLPELADCLQQINLLFLHAPDFYPSLKEFAKVRKQLGIKTLFNFIGPLLNPVNPSYRLLGVSNARMQNLLADHLCQAGELKRALLVHGHNGLDELSPRGISRILRIDDQICTEEKLDLGSASSEDHDHSLDLKERVEMFNRLIGGQDDRSQYYQSVVLNAGAGFSVCGVSSSIEEGCDLSRELLRTKRVCEKYEQARRLYANFVRA